VRVLVYTRTTGYRHASIPAGVAAFSELGEQHGFSVTATEDPARIRDLGGFSAVIFLSTSGEVLDPEGRKALRDYVEAGGGFLGVHSAACTEYGWPHYGDLLGARFAGHPDFQRAEIDVRSHSHPAMAHLPARWVRDDEWYDFLPAPDRAVTVLASVDERTYDGGGMGADHPVVWCRELGGGRSFYTALGHAAEAYADPDFRAHLLGALTWTCG
jgi:type 1 glutamine amidotransferase